MPYKVEEVKGGFKVMKKGTKKTYSKKPLTKKMATKQMKAIQISEMKKKKK